MWTRRCPWKLPQHSPRQGLGWGAWRSVMSRGHQRMHPVSPVLGRVQWLTGTCESVGGRPEAFLAFLPLPLGVLTPSCRELPRHPWHHLEGSSYLLCCHLGPGLLGGWGVRPPPSREPLLSVHGLCVISSVCACALSALCMCRHECYWLCALVLSALCVHY